MKYLSLAGACLNQTPLDFRGNADRLKKAIRQAREQGVQILCLPELAISGYGCEDAFFNHDTLDRSLQTLDELLPECQDMTVTVGLPLEVEHCLYNTVAVIHDTQLLGFVAKQELPGDGIYYEPRWFKPWPDGVTATYEWQGKVYPIGELVFEIDGVRIGLEICEDAWNGLRPAQRHYTRNVDIILNPSASNFSFGKTQVREMLVREASRSYNCTYVYTNLLGNEAGRIIYDGEILIAQEGKLIARNRRFSFQQVELLVAVVDVERVHTLRKKSFNYRPDLPSEVIKASGTYLPQSPHPEAPLLAPMESKEEEFYLAETLALFDYMTKSWSRGFVISLSGGADSSACATLCAEAFARARRELGEAAFWERIQYTGIDPEQGVAEQLLTCVYQGTQNSGPETLESARELAKSLGARFHHWDVSPLHADYLGLAESAIGRKLSWEQDDLTLQNIQARLRAPGIWMLANIHRALLITTSNRSEAAVGYATMDGDTAGGLAPLGGVDKAFLLHWLQWAEQELEISGLQYVNSLQPTAELRPSEQDQSDESDLMPYPLLDAIEKCAIRDYQSPVEVFIRLRGQYPDGQLKASIRKFFVLWSRNQWKRERYAPSFHVDDANLDPKTWCRFPILSGGFKEALAELEKF